VTYQEQHNSPSSPSLHGRAGVLRYQKSGVTQWPTFCRSGFSQPEKEEKDYISKQLPIPSEGEVRGRAKQLLQGMI